MSDDGDIGTRLAAARAANSPYELPAFVANISRRVGAVGGRPVWSTVCLGWPTWFALRFRLPPGEVALDSFESVRRWATELSTGDSDGVEFVGGFESGGGGGVGQSTSWMFDLAFVPGLAGSHSLRLHGHNVELELQDVGTRATVADLAENPPTRDGGCKRCHFPTLGRPDGFCAPCRTTVDRVVAAYTTPFAPTRSLSLMADVGEVLGARTAFVALEGFDTWFNVMCVQSWPPSTQHRSLDDCELAGRWLASDDRGGSYVGFGNGASMEYVHGTGSRGITQDVSFAPGLDPEAKRLRLTLPSYRAADRLAVELAL